MFDELGLTLGFALLPSMTQVFEDDGLFFGFNSLPFQTQVFELLGFDFGLISLPSKIHVLDDDGLVFGLSSFPSQTQSRGNSILLPIYRSPELSISSLAPGTIKSCHADFGVFAPPSSSSAALPSPNSRLIMKAN